MHITAHLDMDVVAIEDQNSVTVMLDLLAPESDAAHERPEHTAVVVLDRSGSMAGRRLAAAKRALLDLVARLDGRDSFGLVVFDHSAQVVIPAGRVSDLGRDRIRSAIASVQPGGMTDMSSGYLRGLQEARRVAGPAGATVILLSDGMANSGICDPAKFRELGASAAAQSVVTSTIGIGTGYDDAILSELAVGGSGNHTFAVDADSAAAAVAGELAGLLAKSVQAASLLITPVAAEVDSITVLNDLPSHGTGEGVMVELGDFYSGEQRRLLFSVGVPAIPALGLATVAEFVLQYVSLPKLEAHTVTLPISVNVVPHDVARGRLPDPDVRRERMLLDVQSTKQRSEWSMNQGDLGAARAYLASAVGALEQVAASAPHDESLLEELSDVRRAHATMGRDVDHAKRMTSASRVKRSRGFRSRSQGGTLGPQPEPGDVTGPDLSGYSSAADEGKD
jgi:Ca-activated chloride channel family protein